MRGRKPVSAGSVRLSARVAPLPITDGPDVSWLKTARPGNDQGQSGSCALQSIANWCETARGARIGDGERLDVYARTLRRLRRPYGQGLTFPEAAEAARSAGWLTASDAVVETRTLDDLACQPLLCVYAINPAWLAVNSAGCLDHGAPAEPITDWHGVLLIGYGRLEHVAGGPWVYHEGSWSANWGYKGCGLMELWLHVRLCRELWRIVER